MTRGNNKTTQPHPPRHTGFKAVSTGQGTTTTSLRTCDPQSRGAGCDTGQQQDKTTTPSPSYWLQGSIHRARHDDHIIADLIRNPEVWRATRRTSQNAPMKRGNAARHSRVGGPFIGTRMIRWQHLSAESREARRDSSETRQYRERMGNATLSTCWIRPWRKLVLALRQYPQGGETVMLDQVQHTQNRTTNQRCVASFPISRRFIEDSSTIKTHYLASNC